jgi:hypothetical protein
MRKRSELLSHVQHTNSQYNLPEIGKNIAYQANRQGVAERFHDGAVHKTIAVDLALITSDDERRKDLELSSLKTAKHHDAQTLSLLQTVPGIGTILSLVLRYEIHDIRRFPRVQDFASYCRLVTCSKESGGKRLGTSGKKIGNAHLTWAFSEAATLFLRDNPAGQKLLARLEKKHDTGKARSILAHALGRAVYCLLKRQVAFDLDRFLQTSGSRAGEPGASLDTSGMSLKRAHSMSTLDGVVERQGVPRPLIPEPLRLIGPLLGLLKRRRWSPVVACAAPPPSLARTGASHTLSQPFE